MPVWRAAVNAQQWRDTALRVRERGGRLVALWASDETTRAAATPFTPHWAVRDGLLWLTLPMPLQPPEFPDLAAIFPDADRMQRAAFDLVGVRAADAQDQRRWLRHGAWPKGTYPLRKSFDARARAAAAAGQLCLRAGHGRRRARDPGRAGACGHHRARSLPLLGGGRARAAPGGASRVHAQGHREALRVAQRARGVAASPGASAATRRSPTPGPMRWRRRVPRASHRRRARCGCARCSWSASASPTTWAIWASSPTTPAWPSAWRRCRA